MIKRFHTGSDIASLGAWDASWRPNPPTGDRALETFLAVETREGNLFLLELGSDGSAIVDVYVDEPPAESLVRGSRELAGPLLLSLPTGKLRVGGLEELYEVDAPVPGECMEVPAARYGITCLALDDAVAAPNDDAHAVFRSRVGVVEAEYFWAVGRWARRAALFAALVTGALVAGVAHWAIAIACGAVALLAALHITGSLTQRSARYRELSRAFGEAVRRQDTLRTPDYIFVLQTLDATSERSGGSARVGP